MHAYGALVALSLLLPAAAAAAPPATCAGADAAPARDTLRRAATATACLLDAERDAAGLGPLRAAGALARPAWAYARRMVEDGFFAHVAPDGQTLVERLDSFVRDRRHWAVGENLAWGTGTLATPRAVVGMWLDSPAHRRNVLDARWRAVGVGAALGTPRDAGSGATYVVEYGARSG